MITKKVLLMLEYDKILEEVSNYAVLETGKALILSNYPDTNINNVKLQLDKTKEAYKLLFKFNINQIYYFDNITQEIARAEMGGTLNFIELLRVASLLRSSSLTKNNILNIKDDEIKILPEIAERIYINLELEKDITSKIISEDAMSDTASEKLFSLRKQIKSLNAKIRDKLNSFMRGSLSKYLQDNIITLRGDRYVIPVKSEYRSSVKGFIHDQSSSGATVFIEPEEVMEFNNELKTAMIEENNEIQRILAELSSKVKSIASQLKWNIENITELDEIFAKATYSYKNNCIYPKINDKGIIEIIKGRHPLIDKEKVIPVTVILGKDCNFLLITGPNTGGKTVTLKLIGLLTAMFMSGIFVPCRDDSVFSVFNDIFCDIGDEQSIKESLSTFSSHMKNIIEITNAVTSKALVLMDEIGAGTDPEEGSGLALAIIEKLLNSNCFGIITTHYSKLKEFAMTSDKIKNASMDFDAKSYAPLYKLNIGIPGSSNAIEISRRLGLSEEIIKSAIGYLSDRKISLENILRNAEESRNASDAEKERLEKINIEKEKELAIIIDERKRLQAEREKTIGQAKTETRRLVSERVYEAEVILEELRELVKKDNISNVDIITARNLKNRLSNSKYIQDEAVENPEFYEKADINLLKIGDYVFSQKLQLEAVVSNINSNKNQIEISVGSIKAITTIEELYKVPTKKSKKRPVAITQTRSNAPAKAEINILGTTVLEGVQEVEAFIDQALTNNLDEVKIIHGVGTGKLRAGIWEYLRQNRHVAEFRSGKYGEGEKGVTIIKLK